MTKKSKAQETGGTNRGVTVTQKGEGRKITLYFHHSSPPLKKTTPKTNKQTNKQKVSLHAMQT